MFLGGIVPGMLMGIALMALTVMQARRGNLPKGEAADLCMIAAATRHASLVLLTPLIVIVGIVGGVFTATEFAAIACVYALVLGLASIAPCRCAACRRYSSVPCSLPGG